MVLAIAVESVLMIFLERMPPLLRGIEEVFDGEIDILHIVLGQSFMLPLVKSYFLGVLVTRLLNFLNRVGLRKLLIVGDFVAFEISALFTTTVELIH